MKRFDLVATGGTFDVIHRGHLALLAESFAVSRMVIIGLTGDELATKRRKKPLNGYAARSKSLEAVIREKFSGARYKIVRLDDDFGPAAITGDIEALVVSQETSRQGAALNRLRRDSGMPKVSIIIVPMVLADDGRRISSSRIRSSEIDPEGNLR